MSVGDGELWSPTPPTAPYAETVPRDAADNVHGGDTMRARAAAAQVKDGHAETGLAVALR
jgi:hypothetical protein